MRSQVRPFTVETKRTRRSLAEPSPTATVSNNPPLNDDLSFGRVGRPPREDLAPEVSREGALALAAQVFGEPAVAQPNSTDLRGSFVPAHGSLPAEPVPNKPRVLPDLLAVAREQIEATEAAKPKRIATRSRGKTKGEGRLSNSQQAALQFDSFELSDETALEHDTEHAARAARGASLNPAPTSAMRSPDVGATPIHPPATGAAVRSYRRNASTTWVLPRSMRWKERRLPRVCWDKFAR
jgi:hypothetical protein